MSIHATIDVNESDRQVRAENRVHLAALAEHNVVFQTMGVRVVPRTEKEGKAK